MLRVSHLAERVGASCIASTSRAVHTATRSGGTPPAAPPSRLKRQQQLKKVKEKHEFSLRIQELTKPDPYLGHQDNEEGHKYWQASDLYKVILSKDAVWGVREDRRGNLVKIEEANTATESLSKGGNGNEGEFSIGPERMNFGLDSAEDRQMLFSDLPEISQQDVLKYHQDPSMADQGLIDKIEDMQWKGQRGVDTLSRILDLKNASGKGIQVENTRRIIDHFGGREPGDERGPDTGSVEVQTAILTYRIRNLHEHLEDNHRHDNHNRRSMNQLVHQRASLLKYLKRKSLSRYEALLPRIGVVPRAVEGEVIVLAKPKMKIAQ